RVRLDGPFVIISGHLDELELSQHQRVLKTPTLWCREVRLFSLIKVPFYSTLTITMGDQL
ncbi:MAG: hypothetical protein ABIK68_04170, partial [bacterium]